MRYINLNSDPGCSNQNPSVPLLKIFLPLRTQLPRLSSVSGIPGNEPEQKKGRMKSCQFSSELQKTCTF